MSSMNPLKFLGGLVLEVGAVIAALAVLPGLGGWANSDSLKLSNTAAESVIPNQVYFDANSSRLVDDPLQHTSPPAAWQNDFAPAPPVPQQRFVENTLDHSSQRALDAAARLWSQGDRLLPADLRVRREPMDVRNDEPRNMASRNSEPLREYMLQDQPRDLPRSADYREEGSFGPSQPAYSQQQPLPLEYRRPSHYAQPSAPRHEYTPRYSAQDQPRRVDERY